MAQPTFQLLLDDASNGGTFPYDITSYVRLADGIQVQRGRGDEFTDIQPSTLAVTLENTGGQFTLGSTAGSFGGALNTDRRIQYKVTANGVTTTRFAGYVQNWPAQWPDGSDQFAVAPINAVDMLARLSRKTLRSIIEEEYLLDGPVAYYTLGEPAGATSAGDSSGSGSAPLKVAGSGSSVIFGSATGPGTDSLTAAQFAGGQGLRASRPTTTPSALWIECFFSTTMSGTGAYLINLWGPGGTGGGITTAHLFLNASGTLRGVVDGGATSATLDSVAVVNDGATHHALLVAANGGPTTLYLDGAPVATSAAAVTIQPISLISVGIQALADAGTLTGVIAHAAVGFGSLSAARCAAHASAGLTGFVSERSDQRVSRLASYGGASVQALETGVDTSVPFVDITGTSPLSMIQTVNQAEGGLCFIRGDGTFVMQNRTHRTIQTTPDLTMTNNEVDPGTQVVGDMQLVQNVVTASSSSTGVVQVAASATSRATHGDYPTDLTGLLISTDEQALNLAQWRVAKYAEPFLRMPNLGFDLGTLTAAQQASVMALEISDRVQITGMLSQAGSTTLDLLLEGWTEVLAHDTWTWQANTSNFSTVTAWVLGDSTYGVLGSTTALGY